MRALFLSAALLAAGPPARAAAPSSEDMALILSRLELYRVLWPRPVDDAILSLRRPVTVSFACPSLPIPARAGRLNGGRRVLPAQTTTLSIRTLTGDWTSRDSSDPHREGTYEWRLPQSYEADGRRNPVRAENRLLLKPSALAGLRGGSLSEQNAQVVLVYHELLHGQLLIDAMRSDEDWRTGFCDLFRDVEGDRRILAPADGEHVRIPLLEREFRAALEKVTRGRAADGEDPWSAYSLE